MLLIYLRQPTATERTNGGILFHVYDEPRWLTPGERSIYSRRKTYIYITSVWWLKTSLLSCLGANPPPAHPWLTHLTWQPERPLSFPERAVEELILGSSFLSTQRPGWLLSPVLAHLGLGYSYFVYISFFGLLISSDLVTSVLDRTYYYRS